MKNTIAGKDFENEKLQKIISELNRELNNTKEKDDQKISSLESQINEMEKEIKTSKSALNENDITINQTLEMLKQKKENN